MENVIFMQDQVITDVEAKILQILGDRVSSLQKNQPLNHDGLPNAYIDPQPIAETGLTVSPSTDVINASIIPISYLEGYPVINGLPFWEKLDGEIIYFYRIFQCYRNMKEQTGNRSLNKVSEAARHSFKIIQNLARAYHWSDRAKAYDIYMDQQLEATRLNNIKKMENKHFELADKLFDDIKGIMTDVIALMQKSPKDTAEYQGQLRSWFKFAVSLTRLSLGLKQDTPLNPKDYVPSGVTNYTTINQNDSRQLNINNPSAQRIPPLRVDKMQEVVDLLDSQGVLKQMFQKSSGGNGHEKKELIEVRSENV